MLITTIVIVLSSGWVGGHTIKTTRHLHKPHNAFVAHLLVAGMINTFVLSSVPINMMISFHLGVEPFISC